jgi:hypothetical protein
LHCASVIMFLVWSLNSSDDFLWHICLFFSSTMCLCILLISHSFSEMHFWVFLMQVLLEPCAKVNRLNSVDYFDDVYSISFMQKRFKWCVCEKSFSHFWAEISEHMNCHHHHAHFHISHSLWLYLNLYFNMWSQTEKHPFEWFK